MRNLPPNDYETVSQAVERLNILLQCYDECRIKSFDGSRLVIIGSLDLSYYHNFEAQFTEVSFFHCATYFNPQTFRLATEAEKSQLTLVDHTDQKDYRFCFESDGQRFFIIAHSLQIREELVNHF